MERKKESRNEAISSSVLLSNIPSIASISDEQDRHYPFASYSNGAMSAYLNDETGQYGADIPLETDWVPPSTQAKRATTTNNNDMPTPMIPLDEAMLAGYEEINTSHNRQAIKPNQRLSLHSQHPQSTDIPARVYGVTWDVTDPDPARVMFAAGDTRRWWQYTWEKRSLLRAMELLSAVGTVGFLGGASSYSSYEIPFASTWFVTTTLVAAILTILWIINWRVRDASVTIADIILTGVWIGGMVGIYQHECPSGSLNGWCDFYNTSMFFSTACLVIQLIITVWEINREIMFWQGKSREGDE
ncbi:hypothetical protein BDF19DRAFT_448255 [Syncephalis fuscata]|nr:hypothetical protein BDF19DRAFT_448255 [Syncephalis fuscata]